jgi:anti-sigma regulatory factor (Ser/Thr protein kinase)
VLLFRLDAHTGELQIANAGMPETFIFHAAGGLTRNASTSIPLGIQKDLGPLAVNRHRLLPGDCFFACSDGLSEIVEEQELVELFQQGGAEGFPGLLQELIGTRVGDRELADDLSWCLWPFHPERLEVRLPASTRLRLQSDEEYLSLRLRFHPATVNYHEVGPNLVGFLDRQGVPKDVSQTLALLLSEAIVNAVDHGSLGLDSALKEAGFEAYEVERSHRLAAGGKGPVDLQIRIHQRTDGAFSHLNVHVVDPGHGFDWRPHLAEHLDPASRPYGRGILLLKALAQDLAFNDKGNEILFNLYAVTD